MGQMKECFQNMFTTHVNTFEMMEEKIIQTYQLSSDPTLELQADLELVTRRSHTIPVMPNFLCVWVIAVCCSLS